MTLSWVWSSGWWNRSRKLGAREMHRKAMLR